MDTVEGEGVKIRTNLGKGGQLGNGCCELHSTPLGDKLTHPNKCDGMATQRGYLVN